MLARNETRESSQPPSAPGRLLHAALSIGGVLCAILLLLWGVQTLQDSTAPRLQVLGAALVVGVFGVWFLFWSGNELITHLPGQRLQRRLQPLLFLGPAMVLLLIYLIYPTLNTLVISFFDARSESFVGLQNYIFAFTTPAVQTAFRNNLLWLVLVTGFTVSLGLIIAALVDRVRYEAVAKSFIFLPLAISFVGASVIWRFVYAYAPLGRPQIGLLNGIVVFLGAEPVGWLIERSINNFALIAIMIWMQTGFCMIVFSAAIKNIPREIFEAARIDGASDRQIFFRITIPVIRGTILTVATTVLVMVLKVFDVVYVMTNGQHGTEVIANRMYTEMFRFRNFGHAASLAVILFLLVIPVVIINIRNLRQQRST